jgi:hypothetical protein
MGARPRQRSQYYFEGRVIPAHRVNGDPDGTLTDCANRPDVHGLCRLLRLFLLHLDRGPAGVVAANRAGVMRLLGLVAMRARLKGGERQRVMSATIALPSMRDLPLGNTH